VLWIGTEAGLDRFDGQTFTHYIVDPNDASSLSPGPGRQVAQDSHGAVWTGTYGGGLDRLEGQHVTHFRHDAKNSDSPANDNIASLLADTVGGLWIGVHGKGLDYFDGRHFTHFPPDPRNPAGLPDAYVIPLLLDRYGVLWIGTTSHGLVRFDTYTREFTTYLMDPRQPGNQAVNWTEDVYSDGTSIWVASPSGLFRLDPETGKFTRHYTEKDGLANNAVVGVLGDARGNLWVSTSKGLSRFDPRTEGFRNYDVFDGLQDNEFIVHSRAKASDGRLFLGGVNGLSAFYSDKLADNPTPPPVVLTEFELFNQPAIIGGKNSPLRQAINVATSITLQYDQSVFRFQFAALDFTAPQKNRYAYKLEGFDRDWQYTDATRRFATYTHLDPSDYRFRVKASNNDGVWNERGVALHIRIVPPWWRTWWFRAVCAVLFLVLMWAVHQLRVHQFQRESKQLRDVIDTIPGYVWSALPDGSVDFINRRWLEFSGVSLDGALGRGWEAAVHPDDLARFVHEWRTAVESGKAMETEARVRRADGQYRWLLVRNVPLRDQAGKIVKWYGTSADIDDRKRGEETLREQANLLDLTQDAIFVADLQGVIKYWNRGAEERYGWTADQAVGTLAHELLKTVFPRSREEVIAEVTRAGRWEGELVHARKDGTRIVVACRLALQRDEQGAPATILESNNDITDRKRAEEERERLRQLEADLAHINRVSVLGELASSIAHEVNQPLSGIVSNGSACLRWLGADVPNVDEARENARRIVRDGKRAAEVIARIRALSKRVATARERLDLNETIQDVLALVGDEAKKKCVIIRTQFAGGLLPVSADRVQLQQVILNLVMNAIEAMNSVGDRARQLVITTRKIHRDEVQVTVEDSGTGIDPQTIDKIFDSFYTTKPGGMGMGLSICRSIVQNHGGRLWATANDGPGTSFHFTLTKHQGKESRAAVAAD
jgi:PAS domain S-box-containing protein